MKIDPNDSVSVDVVNKKLEAFVEVVLAKLIDQQMIILELRQKVAALESKND